MKKRRKSKTYSEYVKKQKFLEKIGLGSKKVSRYKFNKNPMDAFKNLEAYKNIPNFSIDPLQGHTVDFWEKKYRTYLEKYQKAERDIKEKGREMSSSRLTLAEFIEQYGVQARYEREIGRKHDTISSIVMQQKYRYSRQLEMAVREAIKASGMEDEDFKLDWRRARQDRDYLEELPIDWDFIKEDYHRMRKEGKTSEEASHLIGQTYFGSK